MSDRGTIISLINKPFSVHGYEAHVIGYLLVANRTFVAVELDFSTRPFAVFELMPDGSFDHVVLLTYRFDAFEILNHRVSRILFR